MALPTKVDHKAIDMFDTEHLDCLHVAMHTLVPWIDWTSHTRPQGCTDLQSPVKCLDHR